MSLSILIDDRAKLKMCVRDIFRAYRKHGRLKVAITAGRRSILQNSLQHRIYAMMDKKLKWGTDDIKAHCKLHYGVPIMREQDLFNEIYCTAILRNLDYDQKLKLMHGEMFRVTSLMTVEQGSRYISQLFKFGAEQGCDLSDATREFDELERYVR